MANQVEIQVKSVTQRAERGFQQVNTRMEETRKQAGRLDQRMGSLDRNFGGLGRSLVGMAAGAFSVTVVFNRISEAMNKVADTAGFTEAVMAGFTQDFRDNMAQLQGQFESVSRQFAFTSTDAQKAFTVITRESRSANVGIRELEAAMGLARITGSDLATAAQTIGRAFLGDINPLRQVLGEVGSVEEAFQRLREGGLTATTGIDQVGRSLNEIFEDVGESLNNFIEVITPFVEFLTGQKELDLKFLIPTSMQLPFKVLGWLVDNAGKPNIIISFFEQFTTPWLKRLWELANDPVNLTVNFFRHFFTPWLERLWKFANDPVGITIDFLEGTISPWFNRIKDWIEEEIGIRLNLDMIVPPQLKPVLDGLQWLVNNKDKLHNLFGGVQMPPGGPGGEGHIGPQPDRGGGLFDSFLAPFFGLGTGGVFPKLAPSKALEEAFLGTSTTGPTDRFGNLIDLTQKGSRPSELGARGDILSRIAIKQQAIAHDRARMAGEIAGSGNPQMVRQQFAARETQLLNEISNLESRLSALGPMATTQAAGNGGIHVTINGNVDNEQTARLLARQIKDLIQEDIRRGIGF